MRFSQSWLKRPQNICRVKLSADTCLNRSFRMRTQRLLLMVAAIGMVGLSWAADDAKYDPTAEAYKVIAKLKVKPHDWPQWGGSYYRNNTPEGKGIPTKWDIKKGENIK